MRGAAAAAVIVALGFLIGAVAGDWVWGSISMVVVFMATIRFWMRSAFTIDATHVRGIFPLGSSDIRWTDVQSARIAPRGMLLTMRAGSRPRTLCIDFAGLDDARMLEIRQLVRERVPQVESAVPVGHPGGHAEGNGA